MKHKTSKGKLWVIGFVLIHFMAFVFKYTLYLLKKLVTNDWLELAFVALYEFLYPARINSVAEHYRKILFRDWFASWCLQSLCNHPATHVLCRIEASRYQLKCFSHQRSDLIRCNSGFPVIGSAVRETYGRSPHIATLPHRFSHTTRATLGADIIIELRDVGDNVLHESPRRRVLKVFRRGLYLYSVPLEQKSKLAVVIGVAGKTVNLVNNNCGNPIFLLSAKRK